MNVLVACEESQRVCTSFRFKGHTAFSCDIQEPSGGFPEWHIKGNAIDIINAPTCFYTMDGKKHVVEKWDMIIAHPPCTYLANSGNAWFNVERYGEKALDRIEKRKEAFDFFMRFINADCEKICVENPIGYPCTHYMKPTQIIQPYQFGHPYTKSTCLWLKGLKPLEPTKIVVPETRHSAGKSGGYSGNSWAVKKDGKTLSWSNPETQKERSKTYDGIAYAMAEQWG